MSERRAELYAVDVFVAIFKIEHISKNHKTLKEFQQDFVGFDATIREFQIIGEALGNLIKQGVVGDKFRPIVAFRNKIVHEYFGIDGGIIWSIIKQEMPLLKQELQFIVSDCLDSGVFAEAIQCAIEDERAVGHQIIAKFLKTLIPKNK